MEEAYVERLSVPLRWWALAVMFWATALLAFLIAVPAWLALGVVAAFVAANAVLFLGYGKAEVAVVGGVLRAGRARIPTVLLTGAEPLDGAAARRLVGVDADARAYLLLRPYIAGAVRVRVVDPADPTPYWVVATRHPDVLAACLNAAPPPGRVIGQTQRPTHPPHPSPDPQTSGD